MARPWHIVDLDPDENLKLCLRKIALTRFQETFSYEQGTLKGEDIEALHDMRVAARRLRAILRIFKECFPRKTYRKQDETLRSLIRSLGAVRECDVFIELLLDRRKSMMQQDTRTIDLVLARERSNRLLLRRQLLSGIRRLHRARYADSFDQFLSDTL